MHCTKQTIIRTVVLMIALFNQILLVFGKNPLPFSEEGIYEAVSLVAMVGASLWAWWKNNSFWPTVLRQSKPLLKKRWNCSVLSTRHNFSQIQNTRMHRIRVFFL